VENSLGPLPFLALVNKSDIADQWQVKPVDVERLTSMGWEVVETSAKDNVGVENAFERLAMKIMEDPRLAR
jgi:ethanolamine utilization protein EutP (predicted NTPase)